MRDKLQREKRRRPVLDLRDQRFTYRGLHADYDVTRDGEFIALLPDDEAAQIVVVRNWGAELAARLRGSR